MMYREYYIFYPVKPDMVGKPVTSYPKYEFWIDSTRTLILRKAQPYNQKPKPAKNR